jgi:hypothetical protein
MMTVVLVTAASAAAVTMHRLSIDREKKVETLQVGT